MSFIKGFFAAGRRDSGPFASALPPELWDEILSHLPDDDLLRAARACKAFNSLGIRLHLGRHDIDTAALSRRTTLRSSSHQVLPALQLSCTSLQATRLVCHFDSDIGVQRGLVALRDVIRRSAALGQVELTFCRDLFDAHLLDTSVPETSRSQWRMLHELCGALAAMADQAGRVAVISQGTFFSGRASDVGGWTLGSPKLSSSPTQLLFRGRKTSYPPTPLPSTAGARQLRLHEIHSVSMHSVTISPNTHYTLFIFNNASITTLHLTNATPIPPEHLSALLPALEFPALLKLVVGDGIDPTALGDFLLRHPALESLEYVASASPSTSPASAPLTTSPIEHPGLRTLIADGIPNITRTMTALGSSPLLDNLVFTIHPSRGEDVRGLSPALRLIGRADSEAGVHLSLEIKDAAQHTTTFLLSDSAYLTTRALHSVRSARITCASSEMGRAALAWLGVLPALRRVLFVFNLHFGEREDKADLQFDFADVARRVLEDVEVEVKVGWV